MAVASPVKYFHSSMPGAPSLLNQWGSLTSMLDALLVNGFGLVSVNSITISGGVATAQISAGHVFQVDQVVRFSGAVQTAINDEFLITSISATSVQFTAPAGVTTVTGTISARVSSLGYEIAFTGTNRRAYRSKNVQRSGNMLLINDGLKASGYDTTWAKWANVGIVSAMSSINTITGVQAPFLPATPTLNWASTRADQWGWFKWYFGRTSGTDRSGDGDTGSRSWVLVGDDRLFYLFMSWNLNTNLGRSAYCFGDINTFRSADTTHTVLCADDSQESSDYADYPGTRSQYGFPHQGQSAGKVLLRSHTQLGAPVGWSSVGMLTYVSGGSVNAVPFPNAADYSLIALSDVMCRQDDGNIRGVLPGMLYLPQAVPYPDLTIIDSLTNLPGRKAVLVKSQYQDNPTGATTAFDITGPWR